MRTNVHLCSLVSDTCCTPTDCNFGIRNSPNCSERHDGIVQASRSHQQLRHKKLHTDLIGVANGFMKCRRRRVRKLLRRPAKILAQPLVNVVDLHHTDQDKSDQDTEMQEGIDDTILINSGAKSTKTRRAKASTSVSVSAANAVAAPDRQMMTTGTRARQLEGVGGSWC